MLEVSSGSQRKRPPLQSIWIRPNVTYNHLPKKRTKKWGIWWGTGQDICFSIQNKWWLCFLFIVWGSDHSCLQLPGFKRIRNEWNRKGIDQLSSLNSQTATRWFYKVGEIKKNFGFPCPKQKFCSVWQKRLICNIFRFKYLYVSIPSTPLSICPICSNYHI